MKLQLITVYHQVIGMVVVVFVVGWGLGQWWIFVLIANLFDKNKDIA